MRKRVAVAVAAVTLTGSIATSAASQELPEHPHMLVLGVEEDETGPTGYRSCVDLAGNRALKLNAHHAHLHTGRAAAAQMRAGNVVVPGAPLTPWADCEELIAFFFPEG